MLRLSAAHELVGPRLERVGDAQQRALPLAGVVSRHVSNAVSAARNARSTSSAPDRGADAYTSPVVGSRTS